MITILDRDVRPFPLMITIWHLKYDLDREARLSVTMPTSPEISEAVRKASNTALSELERRAAYDEYDRIKQEVHIAAAIKLFTDDGYEPVADVEGDDLEHAYKLTQNGIVSDSWSREPPKGLVPLAPTAIIGQNGREYGRKSSEVGDLFQVIDWKSNTHKFYIVASFGFTEIPHFQVGARERHQ